MEDSGTNRDESRPGDDLMKTLRNALLVVCLVSTFLGALAGITAIWAVNVDETHGKLLGTLAVISLASVVSLGALFYVRRPD
jgi:hypothetical protein